MTDTSSRSLLVRDHPKDLFERDRSIFFHGNNKDIAVDADTHAGFKGLTTPPAPYSSFPSISESNPTANSPLASYEPTGDSKPHHRHDLEVDAFFELSRSTRDQILHHCTTHFLELLDSEISDRLTVRLSRLVMMLPVISVETRAVMRTKVVQVMQQVSGRLTSYGAIRHVVRTAVDGAGLLPMEDDGGRVSTLQGVQGRRRRTSGDTSRGGVRRIQYTDSEDVDGDEESIVRSRDDSVESGDMMDGEFDKDSAWFRLHTTSTSSAQPSGSRGDVDESQIPVVVEVAMEAVIDYMSEVLTPALVIHQLTEAIQSALYQIKKLKTLQRSRDDGVMTDDGSDLDLDINALSSQSLNDHHNLNLLSDDWIWSSPNGEGGMVDDGNEEDDADSKGQDEDLWDQDMEIHDWDSTGHLFEDFEEGKDKKVDVKTNSGSNIDHKSWGMARGDDDDGDNSQRSFMIGIQEDDDPQQYDFDDESPDSAEDYGLDMSQNYRLKKRGMPTKIIPQKGDTTASIIESQRSSAEQFRKRSDHPGSNNRWPGFAPDPRLENLLAQLIEPMLTTFINEDFPAVCKRSQGELMDGIIWSLDKSESIASSISEQDQLALLSEIGY
ncbi:hypothetical protein BGZ98_009435 [Dissophora globulifera]|nr:hypothetical protein BGZ98_009435 [Dissophora globulifera]